MELVLLQDCVASYNSLWLRVANSRDLGLVKIGDRFREQGFGEGAEELEVEGLSLSPVSAASKLFFRRAANNTKAESHRMGCVMLQTNLPSIEVGPGSGPVLIGSTDTAQVLVNSGVVGATASFSHTWPSTTNGSASQDGPVAPAALTASDEEFATEPLAESPQAQKRGRGRPKGSKNRPKVAPSRVTVPSWPGV